MKPEESNPASVKEQADGSRDNRKASPEKCDDGPFRSKSDLPGKTDSGPEPDVFGAEIPPQD